MAERFPVEEIPNEATLYFRIQRDHVDPRDGHITSVPFSRPAMSVNWEEYSTPVETAAQAPKKDTAYVIGLNTGFCREQAQTVAHVPLNADDLHGPNRAHSEVRGKKTGSVKAKLRDEAVKNVLWRYDEA